MVANIVQQSSITSKLSPALCRSNFSSSQPKVFLIKTCFRYRVDPVPIQDVWVADKSKITLEQDLHLHFKKRIFLVQITKVNQHQSWLKTNFTLLNQFKISFGNQNQSLRKTWQKSCLMLLSSQGKSSMLKYWRLRSNQMR